MDLHRRLTRMTGVAALLAALVAGCGGKSEEELVASGKKMLEDKDIVI